MPEPLDFSIRFFIFAITHSALASRRVKAKLLEQLGKSGKWYRLWYNLLSLIMFAWVMTSWPSPKVIYLAPGIWSLVMYATQLLLLVLMWICLAQTGIAEFIGTDMKQTETKGGFITSGCYSLVRHPLYLIAVLFLLLNPVMTTRWALLTILSIIYMVLGAIIEERRLLATYGDHYRKYCLKVPFMLPKIRLKPTAP